MKRRIIAMLLAVALLVGNLPIRAMATENPAGDSTIESCPTEGCTYGAGHEGNCSNYVAPTEDSATENCPTEGCTYGAGHEGNCSNYVAATEPCATEGCTYGAGHEGNCSNYVPPEESGQEEPAVQNVTALIEAIGEVSLESEAAIAAADQAYNTLTEEQKALVTNYQTLEAAKASYMALVVPAPATEETAEPVSVTVSFTAQDAGEFLVPPQLELEVSSDVAERYGYQDNIGMEAGAAAAVTALDVLVEAHVQKYADEFSSGTAQSYLVVDNNYITKMFAEENGGNVCVMVNGKQPGNSGIAQALVTDGDLVELFVYQDLEGESFSDKYTDRYIWLELPEGDKLDGTSVYGGKAQEVVVKGYAPYHAYDGVIAPAAVADAAIYLVDLEDGELTSLNVTTDADGKASVVVPAEYVGQTVYLTAKAAETAMTLAEVTVEQAPVDPAFRLSGLEIAVGGNSAETAAVQTLTPNFEGETTEYSTPILDYAADKNNRFVLVKAIVPEGATAAAKCGSSDVTPLTSGEWGVVQVQGGYFWSPTYSGCLTPGAYNEVLITLSKAGETDKVYTVTIPMQPDISNQSLKWKTDLSDALYITKDDEKAALAVEAEYQNRPLENTDEISYQWYANTTASTEGGTAIEGATAATYVPNVSELGVSHYYVVASCGSLTSITSSVITVTVTEEAAPKSVSIICEHPYTIPDTWTMALGGVKYIAKPGDTLTLKAVDENGKETPVKWLSTSGLNGGSLDKTIGSPVVYTIKNTSYSYVQVASLYDTGIQSEQKVIQVHDYTFSAYNKTPSVTLSADGQSAKSISTQAGLNGSNIWSYTISPENAATLDKGVEEKSNWVYFNALRPGTITVTFDLDLDGDGIGDGNGLTDTATMTINGIAVEDAQGQLTKTYLEITGENAAPAVQLKALSSTENDTITWSSADESVATVDANGLVTAKGVGSVIIKAEGTEHTGGIKVVVTSAQTPYFEQIDFTTTSAWSNGLSSASWKTADFKAATLAYTGLNMTKAAASTLTLKNTTLYNTEKYTAVATYTDANGEARSIPVNSGAATELPDLSFGTSTVTITLTDKAEETRKTVYTFEVTRPRDTVKTIGGIVFTPEGREIWENKFNSKTEGIMYVANEDGSFAQYQGVNATRYYYRTYAMNGLEAFTLTLKGSSAYSHIRYSTDDGSTWNYLGQSGASGLVTDQITFPAGAEGQNPVTKVTIQLLDDATYAANMAAEKDGFADAAPGSYYVWVEQIPILNEECDILTAEASHGDWYPSFREDIQNYRLMVANGAEAPKLTFTVSEGAAVKVEDTVAVPVEGKYTLTLTNSNQTVTVTSTSGNTEKSYTFGYSQKSAKAVPDKVVDYLLINGQYVNGQGGGYGLNPQATLGDNGLTSLGNFGGYITYYYEKGLTDDPNNAYGVDFYVDGNAFEDSSTGTGLGSMEPGQVWVSEDGSNWYALAGSEHYEDSTIWDYSVTYAKTGTGGTGWADNQGNSHSTTHGRSFAWPEVKYYPLNQQLAAGGNIVLSGVLLPCADGTITGKADTFSSMSKGGRFGYVDLLPNGTSNPYLANTDYTNACTGFDLAWAVDGAGDPVDVSGKSFHYVKIVTASNLMAGSANEKSTEVGQVYKATARSEAVGVTTAPTGVTFVSGEKTYAHSFTGGKQIYEVKVPKGMTTATLRVEGTSDGDNIYINNERVASGNASREYSFSTEAQERIRIIVQNGEKEPVIYLLKVTETVQNDPLSALKFTSGSGATAAAYEMTPAFDPAVREYTLVVPDYTASVYAWATLAEDAAGEIQVNYTDTKEAAKKITVTSGHTKGVSLGNAVASAKLAGNTLAVKVGEETAYTVNIVRQATLNKLTLAVGEETVTLTPAFNRSTYAYNADAAHDAVLTVTPTARASDATVTINGGTEAAITPVWKDRCSDLTLVVSGGEGTVSTTYTIHLAQLATRLEIAAPPTKTAYGAGEAFDPSGLQVRAVYNDGFTEILETAAYTYEPSGALSPGDRAVVISFDGKTVNQAITVYSTLQGSGTQGDPFQIYTAQDYQTIYDLVAKGVSFEGEYLKQMGDITLPEGWKPIGVLKDPTVGNIGTKGANLNAFSGNLDGNGKTLTILENGLPLLGYVKNASVRNLNIYGKKIAGYGLVDHLEGVGLSGNAITIENVTLKSGTSTLKSGLIGTYITNNQYAGCAKDFLVTIRDCTIEKNVIIGYDKDQSLIGSFAGRMNGTIENCTSYAAVYGTEYVGGILGSRDNGLGNCSVTNCTFGGTVVASDLHAGGIVGGGYHNSTSPNGENTDIIGCTVTGSITGRDKVGGILGGDTYVAQSWETTTYTLKDNSFTGTVKATGGTYAGGIAGYLLSLNKYADITGNYYKTGCGAERGVGFVQYVDTNCASHETATGATYLNTETSTADCPKVTGCAWKKAHNRTDDPLGADAAKLWRTDEHTDPVAVELKASGSYQIQYLKGEDLDLSGIVLTVHYSDETSKNIALEDVVVTGYDAGRIGSQKITLSYQGLTTEITVTVQNPSTDITVTVSVLGDTAHGNNGTAHTWERGGLTTWVSAKSYTVNSNATVWDVLQMVFRENGISCATETSLGTVYIKSLTYGGVTLAEFTNGPNSGWQYKLNGKDSSNGVAQQYLSNGDVIVFHYTDDYTNSSGSTGTTESAVEKVEKLIDAIGTVKLSSDDAIEKARDAYDKLSAADKAKVSNYSKLTAAEETLSALQISNAQTLISKIGTVTLNSIDKINDAWNAYNALTTAQKLKVSNRGVLADAQDRYDTLRAEEVEKLIDEIDAVVTLNSEAKITKARKAYDALSEKQKSLLDTVKMDALKEAELALANLKATEADKVNAKQVADMIDRLGTITLESEQDILVARTAYEKLTDVQKALVSNYDLLLEAEEKLDDLKRYVVFEEIYVTTGDYLEKLGTPTVGSIGGEWMVLGLIRSGRSVPEDYYENAVQYVLENIDENGHLHRAKSSENSRLILALTAMGKDVTDVAGHNLLQGLSDMEFVQYQGINGPIWALIALDCGNYPVPDGNVTREGLIQVLLNAQLADGGWALSGEKADGDITGMALLALAPYYEKDNAVKLAVEDALACLSDMQNADGTFGTFDGSDRRIATCESSAQVIAALTALGINPAKDARFVKNGVSAVDAIIEFYVTGGGFKHLITGERDGMATEQAYYALTAYYRFLTNQNRLFDLTDVIDAGGDAIAVEITGATEIAVETVEEESSSSIAVIWTVVMTACAAAIAVLLLNRKKLFGKFL